MITGGWSPAIPLYNYRWNKCKRISTTLSSVVNNMVTAIAGGGIPAKLETFFNDVHPVEKFGRYNKVILGPSTDSSNTGAVETINVLSGSNLVITCANNATYVYKSGDPLTLIGTGMPDGWFCTGSSSGVYRGGSILCDSDESYSADPHTFEWTTDATDGFNYIMLKIPRITNYSYLQLSTKIMVTTDTKAWTYNGTVKLSLRNSAGALIGTAITITEDCKNAWYEFTQVINVTTQSQPYYIMLENTNDIPSRMFISGIALSTSEQYDTLSAGSYSAGLPESITNPPRLGSVRVNRIIEGGKVIKGIDNKPYMNNFNKDFVVPNTRYQISYSLSDIASTVYDEFQYLLNWQSRGNLINHFPNIPGVPYYLTGRIKLNGTRRYRLSDLDLTSFKIVFEEVSS